MTIPAGAWPSEVQAREDGPVDWLLAVLAVVLLLIFSQGWIGPLFGDEIGVGDGGLVRAAYFPAYAAGLVILAASFGAMVRAIVRQPLLILMLVIAAGSYLWSISPGETMRRLVALLLSTVAGIALASRFSWRRMAEVMATAFAILALASLVAGVLGIGRMSAGSEFPGAWRGLWMEKNALGGNMAMFFPAFAAAALLSPKRAWIWWGFAGLAILLLLLSTSKTSLVAMLMGIGGVTLVWLIQRGPAMAVAVTWIAVVAVAMIACVFVFASDLVFGVLGKDATLTGRTKIWSAVLIQIQHHPWLGHGYGTVWSDEGQWGPLHQITHDAGFRPQHSHNSWIEQWLWTGMAGLGAWVMFYLQALATAIFAAFRDRGAFLALPFILVYSLISLTESITMTYNDLRWIMFVAIAVKLTVPDPAPAR